MTITRNAIQTPDGTIIESFFRHDYVSHLDKNGNTYMVDGGLDYLKRGGPNDYVELAEVEPTTNQPLDSTKAVLQEENYVDR